jgi:nucleotide-binding universal stress UspA family protein
MKIVVPFDASEPSIKAVEFAGKFALQNSAEVYLLHVAYDQLDYAIGRTRQLLPPPAPEALEENSQHILDEGKALLGKFPGLVVKGKTLLGHPADEICRFAHEIEADMIIIGSRGLTGVNRFLMGSVSSRVVPHAHCSVIVIK